MSTAPHLQRWPIVAAATLLAFTLLLACLSHLTGIGTSTVNSSASIASRHLYFDDQQDGSIRIVDADTRRDVETLAPGTNGFLRGTLRGLARERLRRHLDDRVPFTLEAHLDGRLTLIDPATLRTIELESFGRTNEAVFARLLPFANSSEESRS